MTAGAVEVSGFAWTDGVLDRRTVVRCALSRVCGSCGLSLGRPIAFLGDATEFSRNAFHLPPLHVTCAEKMRSTDLSWQLVLTGGYEFVRPGKDDPDPEPRFVPNSVLGG